MSAAMGQQGAGHCAVVSGRRPSRPICMSSRRAFSRPVASCGSVRPNSRHRWALPPVSPTPGSGDRERGRVQCAFKAAERAVTVSHVPAAHGLRLRVAVDVDEVLGRFVFALNQFVLDKYGMQHQVSDYWVYEFAKIWDCDQDTSNRIVHEFFQSRHFQEGIPLIPGALSSLQRLSHTCDLVVVTSRQHIIQDQTLEWIDKHFPGIFQEVYFGNHWSLEGISRKKSDICRAVGASVLIDDNPMYAVECAAAGIQVLLYDWDEAYPWSKLKPGQHHQLIRVVRDWNEVEQLLHVEAQLSLMGTSSQDGAVTGNGMAQH